MMLKAIPGNPRNQYLPDYVVFDLETTGISCTSDDVVEISALRVRGGRITDRFSSLVNPGRPIPYSASQVNHITDEMVAGEPTMGEILPEFLRFIGDDVLVGHNIARFDMKFLHRDCQSLFRKVPGNDYLDTLSFARSRLPGLRSYALTALASHYGLGTVGAHRALKDCELNQQVFELLAKEPERMMEAGCRVCPRCGAPLVFRRGRFGSFYGCSQYPNCRHTENP